MENHSDKQSLRAASSSAITPTPVEERFVTLDALRGVAVLGILVVNIQSFAMIEAAYFNPTAAGELTGLDLWIAAAVHIFGDQKFMTLFAMLFGAGLILMSQRIESREHSASLLHRRRMGALFLVGLCHAYLLWHGDILVTYALCGLLVYRHRNATPKNQVVSGCVLLGVASLLSLAAGLSFDSWPHDLAEDFIADWAPASAQVSKELDTFRGSYLNQLEIRVPRAFGFQTSIFLVWGVWRVSGLMLIGMALFRLGFLSGVLSREVYWILIAFAAVICVPACTYQWWLNSGTGWPPGDAFFVNGQINYWASIGMSIGYASVVMLACRTGALVRPVRVMAAVGRTAFSNYIGQTLLCTTIFYGHGFGLFGRVDRLGQGGITLAVWVVEIVATLAWLRFFSRGPVEWIWRRVTYGAGVSG